MPLYVVSRQPVIAREKSKTTFLNSGITGLVLHNGSVRGFDSARQLWLGEKEPLSDSIGSKLNGPLIAPIYPISQARPHKYLARTH